MHVSRISENIAYPLPPNQPVNLFAGPVARKAECQVDETDDNMPCGVFRRMLVRTVGVVSAAVPREWRIVLSKCRP